jgi:hypothetical protein
MEGSTGLALAGNVIIFSTSKVIGWIQSKALTRSDEVEKLT